MNDLINAERVVEMIPCALYNILMSLCDMNLNYCVKAVLEYKNVHERLNAIELLKIIQDLCIKIGK